MYDKDNMYDKGDGCEKWTEKWTGVRRKSQVCLSVKDPLWKGLRT